MSEHAPPKTPTDRLADGFTPSSMPPVAPDGGLQLEPAPTGDLKTRPISLCQLGPCHNYHELASELDAQQPLDGSKISLPVIVTRACYPSPGSEIELSGETAIRNCNRWMPMDQIERSERDLRRDRFRSNNREQWEQFEASWAGAEEVSDAG